MVNFTDRGKPEIPPGETAQAKKGLVARWFRQGFALPAGRPRESAVAPTAVARSEDAAAAVRRAGEPAPVRREPKSEAPRTSWEEVLRQRREAAELEHRHRQREEQERSRMLWSHAADGEMGAEQAREILALESGATEPEIRAAHEAMMNCAHPDVRGSEFLTKLVHAAQEILLQRLRPSN